jgi:hypothetical protein
MWYVPVVPATQEAKAGRSVGPRSLRLAWATGSKQQQQQKENSLFIKALCFCT